MRQLYQSEFHTLLCDDVRGLFVYVRSSKRHPTADAFYDDVATSMREALKIGPQYGLVIDAREAVGRNDDAFEQALTNVRVDFITRFCKVAYLVKSAVGVLQTKRNATKGATDLSSISTMNEAEAYAFATTKGG